MTPAERTIPHLEERSANRLMRQINETNGIILREKLLIKLKRIKRRMNENRDAQLDGSGLGAPRRPFGDVLPRQTEHPATVTNSVMYLTQHPNNSPSLKNFRCHSI